MTSFRRGRAKLVTISIWVALAACARPPFSETSVTDSESPSTSLSQEDPGPSEEGSGTTIRWSPFLCDLVAVVGDQQGSVVGTFISLKPGLSGLPWDQPDREYAKASVMVEQVVGFRPVSDAGTEMPPIVVGDELSIVVYPDNAGTPVEELAVSADTHAKGLFVLVALDFPPDLSVEGRWSLKSSRRTRLERSPSLVFARRTWAGNWNCWLRVSANQATWAW